MRLWQAQRKSCQVAQQGNVQLLCRDGQIRPIVVVQAVQGSHTEHARSPIWRHCHADPLYDGGARPTVAFAHAALVQHFRRATHASGIKYAIAARAKRVDGDAHTLADAADVHRTRARQAALSQAIERRSPRRRGGDGVALPPLGIRRVRATLASRGQHRLIASACTALSARSHNARCARPWCCAQRREEALLTLAAVHAGLGSAYAAAAEAAIRGADRARIRCTIARALSGRPQAVDIAHLGREGRTSHGIFTTHGALLHSNTISRANAPLARAPHGCLFDAGLRVACLLINRRLRRCDWRQRDERVATRSASALVEIVGHRYVRNFESLQAQLIAQRLVGRHLKHALHGSIAHPTSAWPLA
mmetsp:Transcript_19722/g.61206  ORF Transcript_19722/g.61206 Transcript_19722/m.61206 type:complete len:363 (-) Transcript_19722:455-1543(-)